MEYRFLVSQLALVIFLLYIPQAESRWYDLGSIHSGEASSIIATQIKVGSTPQNNKITALFKMRLGSDKVSEPVRTPVDGIYQTQFGKNYAYLTEDGRYAFLADLIDLEQNQNLTSYARRHVEIPPPGSLSTETTKNLDSRNIADLLKLRLGSKAVSEPVKTPVDGIYQANTGLKFAYLTQDGRYVFMGKLIDLERGLNLTDIAIRELVNVEMNLFAAEDKAIFPAIGPEKGVVNIFTDTSCSSCTKLFKEVPKLQAAGISIQYLPFPDEGLKSPGYETLRQVWCSKDKEYALTIGKGMQEGSLPAGDCNDGNLVDKGYALGKKVGVVGTPAIFKQNGEQIKGYVPYQKLIPIILTN